MPNKTYCQSHKEHLLEYRQNHKEEMRLYRQKYYQEHREHLLNLSQKRDQRIKFEVLSHYSLTPFPSCCHCRIIDIDVLCLDHINGGGHKQRKSMSGSDRHLFWKLIQQKFPEGYQTLCSNCNLKKEITNHEAKRS